MSSNSRSPAFAIAAILFAGLVGLGITLYFLTDRGGPDAPAATEAKEATKAEPVGPIEISTDDREIRWMYIDTERGLRAAETPVDIPQNARGTVVVWKSDFPEADVYFVVDLFDSDVRGTTVEATPLSPAEFEARARMMVRSTLLAQDSVYFAEDLILEAESQRVRKKSRKPRRRRTVIDRLNRYPSFRIPGQ